MSLLYVSERTTLSRDIRESVTCHTVTLLQALRRANKSVQSTIHEPTVALHGAPLALLAVRSLRNEYMPLYRYDTTSELSL